MRPIAVFPIHDPGGVVLSHLEAAIPGLKTLFSEAIVGLTAETATSQIEYTARLMGDHFFTVHTHGGPMPVGDQFRDLYTRASTDCAPERQLHLCYPDRLVYALNSQYRDVIKTDIRASQTAGVPLLFQRSQEAWRSHPDNYRRLEGIVTQVGQLLFGQTLDYAWCHLVVSAAQLASILPKTSRHDMSFVAEIVVQLRDQIVTRDVDWLAWEDPFIYGRDPQELKTEQEASPAEVQKRLGYVLPMLDVLAQATVGQRDQQPFAADARQS
jgi:hypothetical protein